MDLRRLNDIIIEGIRKEKFILTYIDGDNFTVNFTHSDDVNITIQFREIMKKGYLDKRFIEKYDIDDVNRGIILFKYNGQTIFTHDCYVAYVEHGIGSFVIPENIDIYSEIEEEKDILFETINKEALFDFELYNKILDDEDFEISLDGWRLI